MLSLVAALTRPFARFGLGLAADAVWAAAGASQLGWVLGLSAPLAPGWAILALLGAGIAAGVQAPQWAYRDGARLGGTWRRRQAAGAGLALYLCAAVSPVTGDGVTLEWPLRLTLGELDASGIAGLLVIAGLGLLLWRRGIGIGIEGGYSRARLIRMFHIGTAVMGVGALASHLCACPIITAEHLLGFYAAVLIALGFARLAASGSGPHAWLRFIGCVVTAVLGAGVLFGQLGVSHGGQLLGALGAGWRALVTALVGAAAYLLAPVIGSLLSLVEWLRSRLGPLRVDVGPSLPARGWEPALGEGWGGLDGVYGTGLQLLLIALFAWLLYRGLLLGFRSRFRTEALSAGQVRERLTAHERPADELKQLLLGLLPGWLRPRPRSAQPAWPAAPGQVGIGEVFHLYFEMLDAADTRGWHFDAHLTPNERIAGLERRLGAAPVREITERFNAACYGGQPSEASAVARLRGRLASALDRPRGESTEASAAG